MSKSIYTLVRNVGVAAMVLLWSTSHAFAETLMPTAGTTFYVATTGSDANPGTELQPWRTIQKAANTLMAGQTVIILPGAYKENIVISRSGAAGAPITYEGHTAPVVVPSNLTNTSCLAASNSCILGILSISASQIVFRNMEISGPPVKPGTIAGIRIGGSYDVLAGNFIHNTWKEGISINSSTSHDQILHNYITYPVVAGINFDGQDHLILGNTITHTVTRGPDRIALSGATDNDGMHFFGRGTLVKKNVIKSIYEDESPEANAPHSDCFQTWTNANYITFDGNYCELENSTIYATPMEKFFMIETPSSSTSTVSNIKITNNIFVSKSVATRWTPMEIGGNSCTTSYPLKNISVTDNTFVHPGNFVADFAILLRCASTVSIEDNALYNFGTSSFPYFYQDMQNNSNVGISNNSVFNSTGVAPKGGPYPGDNNQATWMKNPFFTDVNQLDFHLTSTSPLINRGVTVSGVTSDYAGDARPQGAAFDIGSYEYVLP